LHTRPGRPREAELQHPLYSKALLWSGILLLLRRQHWEWGTLSERRLSGNGCVKIGPLLFISLGLLGLNQDLPIRPAVDPVSIDDSVSLEDLPKLPWTAVVLRHLDRAEGFRGRAISQI
jgi:hypothetical protein